MRQLLVGAIVAIVAVVPASAGAASAGSAAHATKAPCQATPVTIKGSQGLSLCGPATAVVHVGGKTYTFSHGFCATIGPTGFQLSLGGAFPMSENNVGRPYFNININTKSRAASGFAYFAGKHVIRGEAYTVTGTVTRSGSFSGTSPAAHGTWSCHGLLVTR